MLKDITNKVDMGNNFVRNFLIICAIFLIALVNILFFKSAPDVIVVKDEEKLIEDLAGELVKPSVK